MTSMMKGIAIFSKYPIIDTKVIPLSKTQDHTNYKTRKALAICCEVNPEVHKDNQMFVN